MKRLLVAIVLVTLFAMSANAKDTVVSLSMQNVGAFAGERGEFYVISVDIPDDVVGKRVDGVTVEFAVDAEPFSIGDSVATPMVGAFPLTQAYRGNGSQMPIFDDVVPSARPIALGEQSVLRMDITDIVKAWIEHPENNHGLVIGALTGPRVSTVTLNSTLPGSGSAIRVRFYYQNRSEDSD